MKKNEEVVKKEATLILDAPQEPIEPNPNAEQELEDSNADDQVADDQASKANDQKPEESKPVPLVVKANGAFSVSIGGSLRNYSVGELEADYSTAKYLLQTGCPVSIANGEEYSQCPSCKHMYKR